MMKMISIKNCIVAAVPYLNKASSFSLGSACLSPDFSVLTLNLK